MVSKGVIDCKEKFKQLKLEFSKRGNNTHTENFSQNFYGLCEKVDKIFYRDFNKKQLLYQIKMETCKKGKLKLWNQIDNMKL